LIIPVESLQDLAEIAGFGGIAAAAAINRVLILSVRIHARRITHENRKGRDK
jgi:hypothetical protein